MKSLNCLSIKESLSKYWGASVEMTTFTDMCVVTLPLRTIDGRQVDVFVEPKFADMILVHDGGKSLAELFAQGIHDSAKKTEVFEEIAGRYGAVFSSDSFSIACKRPALSSAILSIASCAMLAMHGVATHRPKPEEDTVKERVGSVLNVWNPEMVVVHRDVTVKGITPNATHRFDFVCHANKTKAKPKDIAVNILMPTYTPGIQSHKYGFLILDLKGTPYEMWPKVAIIGKSDQWKPKALKLVQSLSNRVLTLSTGQYDAIERELPAIMEQIAAA